MVHDIDVRWHPCDQDGCDYKAKLAGDLKNTNSMFMILTFVGFPVITATTRLRKQAASKNTNKGNTRNKTHTCKKYTLKNKIQPLPNLQYVHDIDVQWFKCG